jgi:DnaA family protein
VLRILPLSDADKVAALEIKARSLGLELTAPVSRYLISRQQRELPALIRLLEQLDRASLAAQRRLTVPFVKSRLEDSA